MIRLTIMYAFPLTVAASAPFIKTIVTAKAFHQSSPSDVFHQIEFDDNVLSGKERI
jgi:hypothetical protein